MIFPGTFFLSKGKITQFLFIISTLVNI